MRKYRKQTKAYEKIGGMWVNGSSHPTTGTAGSNLGKLWVGKTSARPPEVPRAESSKYLAEVLQVAPGLRAPSPPKRKNA